MRGRGRMVLLKTNFKNSFKGNILCSGCEKETDNEEHLFGKCGLLGDLYVKHNITGPGDLCRRRDLQNLKNMVYFIKETALNTE